MAAISSSDPKRSPSDTQSQIRCLRSLLIITLIGPAAASWVYIYAPLPVQYKQTAYFCSKLLLNLIPILWWLSMRRRRALFSVHPRQPASLKKDLRLGLISGLGISLLVYLLYTLHFRGIIDSKQLAQQVRAFGAYDHYLLFAVFLAIVNSGLEEYYWRWFVFGRWVSVLKSPAQSLHPSTTHATNTKNTPATSKSWMSHHALSVALTVAALGFAAHHFIVLNNFLDNSSMALLFSFGIAIGGAIWSLHYHFTQRLLGIWLSHFLVDAAVLGIGYHLLFV